MSYTLQVPFDLSDTTTGFTYYISSNTSIAHNTPLRGDPSCPFTSFQLAVNQANTDFTNSLFSDWSSITFRVLSKSTIDVKGVVLGTAMDNLNIYLERDASLISSFIDDTSLEYAFNVGYTGINIFNFDLRGEGAYQTTTLSTSNPKKFFLYSTVVNEIGNMVLTEYRGLNISLFSSSLGNTTIDGIILKGIASMQVCLNATTNSVTVGSINSDYGVSLYLQEVVSAGITSIGSIDIKCTVFSGAVNRIKCPTFSLKTQDAVGGITLVNSGIVGNSSFIATCSNPNRSFPLIVITTPTLGTSSTTDNIYIRGNVPTISITDVSSRTLNLTLNEVKSDSLTIVRNTPTILLNKNNSSIQTLTFTSSSVITSRLLNQGSFWYCTLNNSSGNVTLSTTGNSSLVISSGDYAIPGL